MKKSSYVRFRNLFHLGYSECSRCGGNWGWKKEASHDTGQGRGLFLFCTDCDKVVTVEERWEALDEWKRRCLKELHPPEYVADIQNTEFLEWPR